MGLLTALFLFYSLPDSILAQYEDEDSIPRLRGPELYATKSATKAFLLGLGPGLLVHGWGHFYVGDNKSGGWLLASECISVVSFYYLAMADISAMDNKDAQGKIETAMTFAATVFVAGWAIDFLDAPNKVIDSRNAHKANTQLSVNPQKHIVVLKLAVSF